MAQGGPGHPRMSPPSSFCQVCKTHYTDYGQHIELPQHRQLQEASPANEHIREMADFFSKKEVKRRPIAKGRGRRGRPRVRV